MIQGGKTRIATSAIKIKELPSVNKKIEIIVNGLEERVPADSTVSNLIEFFKEADAHLIVEYNGQFLYPQQYETTFVVDGDRIEFINPNFGG